MVELIGVLLPVSIALYFIVHIQLDVYKKRIRFLEVKMDALIKHAGMQFDETSMVPVEVHKAIQSGHRLKAIRLYRKITGTRLKEASDVINKLFKNTSTL